ncbi:Thymidine kinase 2, mitochondrial [Geodia barretti]|uniref:Thymidine kinase 2, mitochondrial n=1 Tax=Geodia barretti TaxID=519541 RepID=A0AA35WMZ1_GEOBA|nr:Thymidine kinase 2, mitochondrial [Geodia barretti]
MCRDRAPCYMEGSSVYACCNVCLCVLYPCIDCIQEAPVAVLERSVYSARYCFVKNLHKSGVMDDMEHECYCQWFDLVTRQSPPQLDLIVYLRSSPEVCYQRLQERGRKEEKPVTLEYLQALHECYEDWLGNDKHHSWHGNTPVLVIDGNEDCKLNNTLHKKHCSNILSHLGLSETVAA